MTHEDWRKAAALRIGAAIRAARSQAGLNQEELAAAIGTSRNVIQNYEGPTRGGTARRNTFDVLTLIEIAAVLRVPPVQLIYPDLPDGLVEAHPGTELPSIGAAQWFSGENNPTGRMADARRYEDMVRMLRKAHKDVTVARAQGDADQLNDARNELSLWIDWVAREAIRLEDAGLTVDVKRTGPASAAVADRIAELRADDGG